MVGDDRGHIIADYVVARVMGTNGSYMQMEQYSAVIGTPSTLKPSIYYVSVIMFNQ